MTFSTKVVSHRAAGAGRGLKGACLLFLVTLLGRSFAQELAITGIQVGPDNRPSIHYGASSDRYYVLLRGSSPTNITQPVRAELFTGSNATLTDPSVIGQAQTAFYKVQGVPRETPLDLDGDGLDDVYELLRPLYLDPLNPNDGPQAPPAPVITYPTNATTSSFVIFSGRGPTNTLIRVEGGAAFVTNVVDRTGFFEVTVPLNPNRLNRLFVSAVNEFGQSSPPAPVDILQDSTAPYLFIDFPTNGTTMTASNTLVAGRVGDALSGFLGLSVTVNGQPANVDVGIGPNGTFQRGEVPLTIGTNQLAVVASDRLGNSITRQVTVIRQEPVGPRLLAVSGDLQETNIVRRLNQPLVARVTQANGVPIANQLVSFQVTRSDGRLLPVNTNQLATDFTRRPDYSSNGAMFVQLFTDASGEARVWWTMGMDAGHANNRVAVTGAGLADTVFFCASATALPANQINIGSGNNQRGETFGPAAEPLKVWVSDGNNPAAGIQVTFRVTQGGGTLLPIIASDGASPSGPGLRAASRASGSFVLAAAGTPPAAGSQEVTVFTSMTGHAEVDFTFGPAGGNQVIEATFPGYPGLPATFTLNALARVPGKPTTFIGLIQDNAVQPVGHAYVELEVAGARYQTFSDVEGRFAFSDIAAGAGHLKVDGITATSLGTNAIPTNSFPALQYTMLVVPNAENSLPTPVLLPRLNTNNTRWYYGTNDIVLTCEGMAGLKMTVKANSMKHPGGEIVSPGRPALLSLNQVHHDDIPMPMPDGASPPFAWTLQPGGATFDPPVQVEYPNMSGLAPGAAAFFLTFNHDTERFEIVATGHVVEDGSKIVCDPGAGLTISGWGCNCPPYSVSGKCCKAPPGGCKVCQNNKLVPAPDGTACDDGDNCTPSSKCVGGQCKGSPPSGVPECGGGGQPAPAYHWTETVVTTNIPGAFGYTTIPQSGIKFTGGACYNSSINSYMYDLQGITVSGKVVLSTAGFIEPNPVPGGNVFDTNYCCMIQKLSRYSQDGGDTWHMLAALRAHENYHKDHDFPDLLNPLLDELQLELSGIIVSCETPNAARVANDERLKAQLKMMNKWEKAQLAFVAQHAPSPTDDAYKAGQQILNPMIQRIRDYATSKGFPACTANPCAALGLSPLPAITNLLIVPERLVLGIGQSSNLTVLALYNDGSTSDLTASGAEYTSGDAQVLSIDANGQVTALAPGMALATFTYLPPGRERLPLTLSAIVFVATADDRDADGMPNSWETQSGFNPDDPTDADLDADGDGLSNLKEFLRRTDPLNADTDGDGASDGVEVAGKANPLSWPTLDSQWVVTVGAQTVQVNDDGSFEIPNISAPDQFGAGGPGTPPDFISDDFVRLTGHRQHFGNTLYVFSEPFRVQRGVSITLDNLVYTRTPPPVPESIVIVPESPVLAALGQTTQVHVTGRFAGGGTGDLTPRTAWTSYRSSNPGIAVVDPDGVVTARAKGMVFITAVNDGATAVCQIDVVPGDLLTVVRGTIRDTNGAPVTGVTISLTGLATTPITTGADGSFVFTNVPTSFGALRVLARVIGAGSAAFATILLDPVAGGITDAGNLTLQQGVAWVASGSGVWHGPTNWSSGAVPGPGADVYIAAAPGAVVTISQGSNVVNNLVLFTPLRLTGGSLRTVNPIQANSPLQLVGGTLARTVVESTGLGILGTNGTLDGVTLNCDMDVLSGTLTILNGLTVNRVTRIGHPTSGFASTLNLQGSQTFSGTGSLLFGNSGCNTVRLTLGGTTLTNRLLIRGHSGQVPYSSCAGGPLNVALINEGTIAADLSGGTITVRGQPVRNFGSLIASPGTLRLIGLAGNLGTASISGGHLDLDGIYTNNLALPVNAGTLTLNGDWFNGSQLLLTNSVLNLDGTFGLGDLGNITRIGGAVRVTGLLNGTGGALLLNAGTGNWSMNGGTLRQLTVNSADGALLLASSTGGTLDGVTLNCDLDVQNGTLSVTNGLAVNALMRVGNPTNGFTGQVGLLGSQALGGSGSIIFGNSGCNTLRLVLGNTTLTNRLLIRGHSGQVPYSSCAGGPLNVALINEGTLAADLSGGTITVRGQPVRNFGSLVASPGTLRLIGLTGDLGVASVTAGHLDVDGIYTNNLALPVNGGTLTLNGDWFNGGQLLLTNSVLNLDGTFGLGDLGNITRIGGSVRVTGLLNGAGDTLLLDASTGNWSLNGGTLRQLTVDSANGALLLASSSGGTLDGVTLNANLDVQAGNLGVTNGLVVNGLMRVGHPTSGVIGQVGFLGSQAISGSGSIVFGNSSCNTLRLVLGGTTLTNRLLIHGHTGQLPYSTCAGGPLNVAFINEATVSADIAGGTITVRGQSVRNAGTLLAGPGILSVIGLSGNLNTAATSSGGILSLDGTYTNNLALPINGGTLSLNGDWFNGGQLLLTNATLNLGGTFALGDLGNITRIGGAVRVTGLLNGAGDTLQLDADTGNWVMNGGTLRQLTVNSADGALLLASSAGGTLDGVTLNCDLDVQNGSLSVTNGLIVNGVMRVGHPTSGVIGQVGFLGSQAVGGSGSIVFGNSSCNTLRLVLGGTTLTNRLLIRGHTGQLPYSSCVGGPLNVAFINEATVAADLSGGTITVRGQPVRNFGSLIASPGTLRLIGLTGDLGVASVTAGHLDVEGTYTNNLGLPVNAGTLTLNGDWFNAGQLLLTNSVLNLDGAFGLGDLGSITRIGGSVRVTGLLNGAGGTLLLDASTGNWSLNGGTLRQLTVNSAGGALLVASGSGGTLDGATLNTDLDVQNGNLNVTNGLVVNGVMRVGHPTSGVVGQIGFLGSQAISGSGSVLFGNSGCNTLRLVLGNTTLTNRLLIHGHTGQLPYSSCVGGPLNVALINEATVAADVAGGTLTVRGQPVRNFGSLSANPGTLRLIGLAGDLGLASVSAGHLDLDGAYTNNLALPVNGGTLTLNGDWFNGGQLLLTNSVLNLDGTFGLGDLGNITRIGGSVRVTGLLNGAGGTLTLDTTTGNWSLNGGTLRQLTVNSTGGALLQLSGSGGLLDGVTLNCDLDGQTGGLNVTNGLVLNGLLRVGHPTTAAVGQIGFLGSQALSGSGSVIFGNSGCNTLRMVLSGTTLTNRVLIHGHTGQLPYSSCVGGPLNVGLVNEATISADVNLGTITIRAQPFTNLGTTNALNGGRLVLIP